MPKPRLHIYYDGDCPMCQAFANVVAKDQTQNVETVQSTTSGPAPLAKMLNEIHVVEADGTIRTGPDAVLTALSQRFPLLRPLKQLARLPIVSTIANHVYGFVSRRRKLWFGGAEARLYWLRTLTWIGLLGGLLAVLPLFSGDRNYPLIPIIDGLVLTNNLTYLLFVITIASAIWGILSTRRFAYLALITFLSLLILVLADYTRLQPWIWHYGVLLGLFALACKFSTTLILDVARFVIAGIYFWSGFQKLNQAFFVEVFPWFTEALWSPWGETGLTLALGLGLLVPFLQMAIGLGLIIKPLRKAALFGALAMLVIVLLSLVLRDWNSSVWLWNIVLFMMAFVLFAGHPDTLREWFKKSYKTSLGLIILALFWLVPFLNIFNLTDYYLSWSLYSGQVPTAYIYGEERVLQLAGVPLTLAQKNGFALLDWSIYELNVVPYPEKRVFWRIHEELCRRIATDDSNIWLLIEERDFFFSLNKRQTTRTCLDIN